MKWALAFANAGVSSEKVQFLEVPYSATAYAASLRYDRFGSDSTNDKQLSLASRVSHSGLDPESPPTGSILSERITWPDIEFVTEVVEDVVEDDDGDLGDVAIFEFGEGGT
jgi:hypothetical protein